MSLSTLSRPLLLLGMLTATTAWAARSDYDCESGSQMRGDFSPRKAEVQFEGEKWSLDRVRDSREARYSSRKAGVTVTMVQRTAVIERKGHPKESCKLVSQALRPEALGLAPAASAPASAAVAARPSASAPVATPAAPAAPAASTKAR